MNKLKCPECKQVNTVEFWDSQTKEQQGIDEKSHYMSAEAATKDHQEVESYYNCPICNEEVSGVDLIKVG